MIVEQILSSYLRANAGLVALIDTRLYPGNAPEMPTKPYVVFDLITCISDYVHDGTALETYTLQFSAFDTTYLGAATIRQALVDALGGLSSLTVSGTKYQVAILHKGTRHFFETETLLHHMAVDFEVTVL